jgi:PiT family inorganic phosphate transporter
MIQEILLLLAGVYLAWSLGANDAGNIISTLTGSKTISAKKAMIFLVLCLSFGAIFLSDNVIKTVSSGIVDIDLITMPHATIALLVSALWVHFATWKNWPVSISQSVVSSVLGIGIVESLVAGANLVQWKTIITLAGVWVVSPLFGFFVAWLVFHLLHRYVTNVHLYFKDKVFDFLRRPFGTAKDIVSGRIKRRERILQGLLIFSSGYMALALGASTVASTTGLIHSGFNGCDSICGLPVNGVDELFVMKMVVLVSVILGVITLGQRLVDFLGTKLIKLNALRGASVQGSAATVIIICALLGYPVSSTGVFVGAFLGMDAGDENAAIKSHLSRALLMAFAVTIPVTATLSGLFTWLFLI